MQLLEADAGLTQLMLTAEKQLVEELCANYHNNYSQDASNAAVIAAGTDSSTSYVVSQISSSN